MNKRNMFSAVKSFRPPCAAALLVCAAAFVCGSAAGTFLSAGLRPDGWAGEAVSGYFAALENGGAVTDLAAVYWWLAKYHVLAFLLGFSMLGVPGIPALSFARGFSLSFTMALLVRSYAANGAIAGALLFGAAALFSVPLYFLIASAALEASLELTRRGLLLAPPNGPGIYTRPYFLKTITVFLLLAMIAIGERALLSRGLLTLPVFI